MSILRFDASEKHETFDIYVNGKNLKDPNQQAPYRFAWVGPKTIQSNNWVKLNKNKFPKGVQTLVVNRDDSDEDAFVTIDGLYLCYKSLNV